MFRNDPFEVVLAGELIEPLAVAFHVGMVMQSRALRGGGNLCTIPMFLLGF
jgi:hypothetical protein